MTPTTKPLTPEQVQEYRALADAATPGPWECDGIEPYAAHESNHATGHIICLFEAQWRKGPENKANALFVARSRTAVPDLCDTIVAKDAEIAELRREVKVQIGTSCLTRDLVWCECGRGLSNTGIWKFCPNCGGKIDQESYRLATAEAASNGAKIYRSTEDTEVMAELQRQNAELLAGLKGLLPLAEKMFGYCEQVAATGVTRMQPAGVKFTDLKFAKMARDLIAKYGGGA